LEVLDIKASKITHTQSFAEVDSIYDIIAIDGSDYLLATEEGLFRTNKDKLINHYYKGKYLRSLCHITDSIYLLGFANDGLIVWDQEKD
jgi:hypothetical protein